MKILLVLLVACTLATSGHTSAAISGESQTLDAGGGRRLRSSLARFSGGEGRTLTETQSLLSRAEATIGEEVVHSKPGPFRRFVVFLAEKAGIPLPTINHQKTPGNGYSPGSPMFNDQEAWVARNGDNVRMGTGDDGFPGDDGVVVDDIEAEMRWIAAMGLLFIFLSIVLSILIYALLAYLYLHFSVGWRQTKFLEQVGTHQDFLHGPFDCNCSSGENQFDWQICLCASFCGMCRWADTVSSPKMFPGKFWTAFFTALFFVCFWPFLSQLLILFLALMVPIIGGFLASCCLPCIVLCPMPMVAVYFRQQMRTKFGHEAGDVWTWVCDMALWCCCPCCAIVQEAREVEKVNPGLVRKVVMQPPAQRGQRYGGGGYGGGGDPYAADGGGSRRTLSTKSQICANLGARMQYVPQYGHNAALVTLQQMAGVEVQEKADMIEAVTALLGHEVEMENRYRILDQQGAEIMYAVEKTDFMTRQLKTCCSDCAPWEVDILYTYGGVQQKAFSLNRPCTFTCCCLNRPEMTVVDATNGAVMGKMVDPCACCDLTFTMQDPEGKDVLKGKGGCCQCGLCCALPCGPCSEVNFPISDASSGADVGHIQKKVPSCLKFLFASDVDNYKVEFGKIENPNYKAMLIAMAIFIDFRYFNDNNSQGPMQQEMS